MSEKLKEFIRSLGLASFHWVAATAASFIIGFVPEALLGRHFYNTGIEAFFPVITIVGLALGIAFSGRFKNGRGASWAWIFGLLWLAVGIHDLRSSWGPSWSAQRSSWDDAKANLFGPASVCSASECLYELAYTMPFAVSVSYSLGAFIRRVLISRLVPKSASPD